MKQDKLIFSEFDDIKPYTKTFTATTNLIINIVELYKILPVTDYVVIPKKRGRKKKIENIDPNQDIKPGSIITIKYQNQLRGIELKPKKEKIGKKKKWFRNSITIVIIFDKPINFKVCRNGTFQMTGCKTHEHAELCVKYIWDYMKLHPIVYSFSRSDTLEILFIPSMRNIHFSLGFLVDREKLNRYICMQKEFYCLLETSFGYTGVNIKIPLTQDISMLEIKKIVYDKENDSWNENWTTYKEYLSLLTEKERYAKMNETKYNTFLVFQSGKTIMSGLSSNFMKDVYYYFLNIIKTAYNEIEERLEPTLKSETKNKQKLSLEEEMAMLELGIMS